MYKIYINETPLFLLETNDAVLEKWKGENVLIMHATGKQKQFFQVIDSLEKMKRYDAVLLHGSNADELFEKFSSLYKILEAAGGIVKNEAGEILFIFRRGFWDLPKGKIDKGETPEEAAVREVEEETGLQKPTLGKLIGTTWHTYRTSKNRILKKTYWYAMQTVKTALVLQSEEDIEAAEWSTLKTFLSKKPAIYNSILDILQQYDDQEN